MRLSTVTDIGKNRKENQDNYWGARLEVNGEEVGVLCICDGMGGLNDGGLASRIVVEAVRESLLNSLDLNDLLFAIEHANSKIYDIGNRMGTTCTVLVCRGGTYNIFHVGDSRCYLIRDGKAQVLTEDHSALVKYGITRESNEELWKKYRGLLTRCIGVKQTVSIDSHQGSYTNGDRFLLCSDGLWHYFDTFGFHEEDIADLDKLVNKCMEKGETDNISVGVLSI